MQAVRRGESLWDVVKANGQINAGAAVYWDADGDPQGGTAGTGAATTTSSSNTFIGFAIAQAGASAETVRVVSFASHPIDYTPGSAVSAGDVVVVGSFIGVAEIDLEANRLGALAAIGPVSVANTVHADLSNAIADPGAAGAIPVTNSGYCPLVTAGAEARTLAAPTWAGQQLLLELKTDGGDLTLTVATGINQTGNTQAVAADAGDMLLLVAIEVGANLRWRVVANDGWALSTP